MTSRVRYLNDPAFHNLVNAIASMMKEHQFLPSDLKEAVEVAIDMHTEDLRRKLRS